MGNGYTITLPLEVFTQRNFVADVIRLKLNFAQKCVLSHPLADLGVAYGLHWKARGDFLFVIIDLFSRSIMVETL